MSIERIASFVDRTPKATIKIAPMSAIPVLSSASPGISPIATPAYVIRKIINVRECISYQEGKANLFFR